MLEFTFLQTQAESRVDIFIAYLQFATQRMHVIHGAEQAQVLNMTPEREQLQSAESGGVWV